MLWIWFIYLSIYISISIYLFLYLFIYLSIYFCIYLSIYPFVNNFNLTRFQKAVLRKISIYTFIFMINHKTLPSVRQFYVCIFGKCSFGIKFLIMMLHLHQIWCKFVPNSTKRKLVQIRYHKGTKILNFWVGER